MKISNREKFLLGILLTLLVLVSYYNFVYKPQSNKVSVLKKERKEFEDKVNNLNLLVRNIPKKESDIKILNSKIQDKSLGLYPEIIQEKIITEIDKLMNQAKISGNITFTEISNQSVENSKDENKKEENNKSNKEGTLSKLSKEYNSLDKTQKNINEKSKEIEIKKTTSEPIEQIKASINFKGKYEDVITFVKSVDEYTKKLAISTMNISQNSPSEVSGNMTLEFFAIPKLGEEDKEYFKWDYNNSYGKLNMFDSSQSISLSNNLEGINSLKNKNYDFVMSLRPINSDLPTVTLGRTMDLERKSYVYADSAKEEKVQLYITENKGKYYFKYKTSRNSYPSNFQGNGEEFELKENSINLKIYSNKRISDQDESTVNLEIYNKTGKTLNVFIEDDDVNKPRVNINANSGSVEVKKE